MVGGINSGYNSSLVQNNSGVQKNTANNNASKNVEETKAISRVDEIKQQIEAGTYKVDIQKTAEAMVDTLI
jgi:anti-sigma28 factor (negative regulator of flagellin synthesis)